MYLSSYFDTKKQKKSKWSLALTKTEREQTERRFSKVEAYQLFRFPAKISPMPSERQWTAKYNFKIKAINESRVRPFLTVDSTFFIYLQQFDKLD